MNKIAAVTMVYNESEYLPIWCKYYGDAVGPQNCFIIDHGSDDRSTERLNQFNVLRIPRSPKDNEKRTRFVSSFCSNLLEWYDAFIHTDVDEIVVPGPGDYEGLADFVSRAPCRTFSAYGFDIHQELTTEQPLDLMIPITKQRRWLRFSSSMCKPVISFKPIEWASGFHSANAKLEFRDLYLFHLRYFDLSIGLARLARTRGMAWSSPMAGRHQRMPDDEFHDLMDRVSRLPKLSGAILDESTDPLNKYVERVKASEQDYNTQSYNIDLHIFGDELIELPATFIGKF